MRCFSRNYYVFICIEDTVASKRAFGEAAVPSSFGWVEGGY